MRPDTRADDGESTAFGRDSRRLEFEVDEAGAADATAGNSRWRRIARAASRKACGSSGRHNSDRRPRPRTSVRNCRCERLAGPVHASGGCRGPSSGSDNAMPRLNCRASEYSASDGYGMFLGRGPAVVAVASSVICLQRNLHTAARCGKAHSQYLRSDLQSFARPSNREIGLNAQGGQWFSAAAHCWISGTCKARISHLRAEIDRSIE